MGDGSGAGGMGWVTFRRGRQFFWKSVLLAVSTVSLVPVLLYKSEAGAAAWLVALVAVHVAGVAILVAGSKRHHIAPDARGLAIRLVGIAILVALLYMAGKGLTRFPVGDLVFWGVLFAVWALHTLGLLLLHVRTRREASVCPFA